MAAGGFLHFVGGQDDGQVRAGTLAEEVPEAEAGGGVKAGAGFIQDEDGRIVTERRGQREPLLPSVGQVRGAHGLEGVEFEAF